MARSTPGPAETAPKDRLVLATLDLLRRSGLAGAGINRIVDASKAPKGSVYHYFPGGKQGLVTEALREAEREVGKTLFSIFRVTAPVGEKVQTLFSTTAAGIKANGFTKGCPVAAVTLDLDDEFAGLREICRSIFDRWVDLIAQGLDGVPEPDRPAVAQLILATLEGGLILSRGQSSTDPLLRSGAALAQLLDAQCQTRRAETP